MHIMQYFILFITYKIKVFLNLREYMEDIFYYSVFFKDSFIKLIFIITFKRWIFILF